MKIFSKAWESIVERHPSAQELIDLHEERLSESGQKSVRRHVLKCTSCQAMFQHVGDFFEPIREGEQPLGERERQRQLDRLWLCIPSSEEKEKMQLGSTGSKIERSAGFWRAAALSAGLVTLLITGGLVQTWRLYRSAEGQVVAMQRQRPDYERPSSAETQVKKPQGKTEEPSHELQQLRSPQLNIPVMEVFSTHERDSNQPRRPVLRVPANVPMVVLVLNSESEDKSGRYSVEITNSLGQAVWSGQGLQRDPEMDRYTLSIPADRLSQGDYVISVYGQAARSRLRVDRYSFRIVRGQ